MHRVVIIVALVVLVFFFMLPSQIDGYADQIVHAVAGGVAGPVGESFVEGEDYVYFNRPGCGC